LNSTALPERRGQAIGWRAQAMFCSYLFENTPVQRIEAATHAENIAEQRALEKGRVHPSFHDRLFGSRASCRLATGPRAGASREREIGHGHPGFPAGTVPPGVPGRPGRYFRYLVRLRGRTTP